MVCECGNTEVVEVPPRLLGFGPISVFVDFACADCIKEAEAARYKIVRKGECCWCKQEDERRILVRNNYHKNALYHKACLAEKKAYPKELKRVIYQNFRAEQLDLVHDLTPHEWIQVLESYGPVCVYCGGEYQELEHKTSIEQGGGTTKSNVVPSCRSCNRKKKHRDLEIIIHASV